MEIGNKLEISVIISTYNAFEWLEKVIAGYEMQQFQNFEILIADDGSSPEVVAKIKLLIENSELDIKHIWHEDNGFRKTIILNKAILESNSDYLLMTDGDCIPRKDFVETHYKLREKGRFLSGGYFKLPLDLSNFIIKDHIKNQECFDLEWLQKNGLKVSKIKGLKIDSQSHQAKFLNSLTPTKPSWNGHNSSGWKQDIIKVGGFDERMEYGAEDREMGIRLYFLGIKGKQIRYSAICLHLDHSRGYVNEKALAKNKEIFKETIKNKSKKTAYGL